MADATIRAPALADPVRATISFRLVLDEVPIGIRVWMNPRSFRWFIDIRDSTGAFLVQGHGLVAQADVFEPYRSFGTFPGGQLFVFDTGGLGRDPEGFGAWKESHLLRYRPAADVGVTTDPVVV